MTRGQTHQVEGEKIEKLKTKSEQAKKSKTNKVGQRNKLWLIKTTNNNEGGDKHGVDYQDNNTDNEIHTDNDNVRQRNKWWLIKTTNTKEVGEHGVDYQDNDDDTFVKRKVNVRNIVNEHTTRSRLMS